MLWLSMTFYEESIATAGDIDSHKKVRVLDNRNFIINLNKPDI